VNTQRIEDKLDRLDSRMDTISEHLAAYNEQLKIHIQRSDSLEEAFIPVRDKVNQGVGALKLIGLAALIATVVSSIGVL